MVYVFLAEGFEETEALETVDILRRADIEVQTVSITGSKQVTGAHHITVCADCLLEEAEMDDSQMLVLPGGLPGATNLASCAPLLHAIQVQVAAGRYVAAICAAPMVLGKLGLLEHRRATCYPGFDKYLAGADYTARLVETDGNIITGKGPAAVAEFAFALVRILAGEAIEQEVRRGMLFA